MPAVPNTPQLVVEQTLTKPKSVDPHVLHQICHFCDLDPNIEGILEYIPSILRNALQASSKEVRAQLITDHLDELTW